MKELLSSGFLSAATENSSSAAVTGTDGRVTTYGELADRASGIAQLIRNNGLPAGSRIALLADKSSETVAAILGIHMAECCYIPIDIHQPQERIQYILRDADPDMLLCERKHSPSLNGCTADMLSPVKDMNEWGYSALSSDLKTPADLAYILYTSGSTGQPKGVCVSHDAAMSFVKWGTETFFKNEKLNVSSIAPFHFDLSVLDLFCTLHTGSHLHLCSKDQTRNTRLMAEYLSSRKTELIYCTPTFLSSLLHHGKLQKYNWEHLQYVLFAGETFAAKHLHELMEIWSRATFYNLYGPTETNVCTWFTVPRGTHEPTEVYPIGKNLPEVSADITEEGELLIGGSTVAHGYLNQEELTRERFFTQGNALWFRTGDLVTKNNKGELIYQGRKDRMVKRRGFRIEPAEIEIALLRIEGVESCAVTAVNTSDGVHLIAHLTGSPAKKTTIELKEICSGLLPEYMIPHNFMFHSELPLTSSGKTDHQALSKMSL